MNGWTGIVQCPSHEWMGRARAIGGCGVECCAQVDWHVHDAH